MNIDLGVQPITDIHCFSFAPQPKLSLGSLSKVFLSGGPTVKGFRAEVREEDLLASVDYHRMIHELSVLLGMKGSDGEVLERRNARARDFAGYVKELYADAKIGCEVLDNGIEPVGFEEFREYAPARLYRVFRIEPLLKRLLAASKTFASFLDSFDEAIQSALKKQGFVGLKSVAAYRTGLDVGDPDEAEARRSFASYSKGKEGSEWFGPRVKPVRDFLLCRAAEKAGRLGAFLEVHTGVGDTDVVADRCNPLLLKNFLRSEKVSRTPVVLIHGGFPFTSEAAWLANVFPNVHFELSTPLPPVYVPPLSKERFKEVLEVVPTTRIVYGSDSIELPETHWLSAKLAKRALGGALADLVGEGVVDEDEAYRMARRILDSNAAGLLR